MFKTLMLLLYKDIKGLDTVSNFFKIYSYPLKNTIASQMVINETKKESDTPDNSDFEQTEVPLVV